MSDKILVPQSWYNLTGKAKEALSDWDYGSQISSLLNQALSSTRQNKRDEVLADVKVFLGEKGYTNTDSVEEKLPGIIKTLDYHNMWNHTVDSLRHLLRVLVSYKNEIITIINEKTSQLTDEWEAKELIPKDCDNKEYIKILWTFFNIPSEDFQKLEDLYKEETSEKKKEVHEKRTERWTIDDNMTLEEANQLWWEFLVDKPSDNDNVKKNKAFLRENISYWTYKKYERERKWIIPMSSSDYWWIELSTDEVAKVSSNPEYKIPFKDKYDRDEYVLLSEIELISWNALDWVAEMLNFESIQKRLSLIKNNIDIFKEDRGTGKYFFFDVINDLNIENEWGNELWWDRFIDFYSKINSLRLKLSYDEKINKVIECIRACWIKKTADSVIEKWKLPDITWGKVKRYLATSNIFPLSENK